MKQNFANDSRIVMTLDAGGTNFKFSAIRGNQVATTPFSVPTRGDCLDACLGALVDGFERVRNSLPQAPAAISFAFPGPADYDAGIIGDLRNLPCFRGGIALGPMLSAKFRVPVFISNDGDLFTYGEAIAGFLPHVNALLEKAGSPKRYRNLFGITLGTGLGGGIVRDGELFGGDNVCAGEIWLLRNKVHPEGNAEEGACIRAVRTSYAELTHQPVEETPDPQVIFAIGSGFADGYQDAARESFRRLGETVGDVVSLATCLLDSLTVIGGGLSGAWPLFIPALLDEMNSQYIHPSGNGFPRLTQKAYNLEDAGGLAMFLRGEVREIKVPGTSQTILYDPLPRVGVGISRLGTSEAVAIGAYAHALSKLDKVSGGTPRGHVRIFAPPVHILTVILHYEDGSRKPFTSVEFPVPAPGSRRGFDLERPAWKVYA